MMATPTYKALANITLSSSVTSVTFSSISQEYKDLVLVYRGSSSSGQLSWRVNGLTGIDHFVTMESFSGSANYSQQQAQATINQVTTVDSNVSMIMNLLDYSATDKNKTFLVRMGAVNLTGAYTLRSYTSTAVTSLRIQNVTFYSGSTFQLFGIAA